MSENTPAPADDVVDWRKLAINLAMREADYRLNHDVHGGSDIRAGRAWDQMRQAGDRVRDATLAAKPDQPAVGEEITRLRAENERLRGEGHDLARHLYDAWNIVTMHVPVDALGGVQWPVRDEYLQEWWDATAAHRQALQETGDAVGS